MIPLAPVNRWRGASRRRRALVLENVRAILAAAGTSMDRVLKTTCFLMDRDDFEAFNVVYREFFPSAYPGTLDLPGCTARSGLRR